MVAWHPRRHPPTARPSGAAPSVRASNVPRNCTSTTGIRAGSLWDLSAAGARVALDDPPRAGTEVLLKWQSHEAFGRVAWVADGMCGVTFDRMLPRAMLDEGLLPQEEAARAAGPAAAVGSIPLGRSRFGRRNAQDVPAAPVVPAEPIARDLPAPKRPPEPIAPPEPVVPDMPVESVAWEETDEPVVWDVPVPPAPQVAPAQPVARKAPAESVAEEVPAAPTAPNAPPGAVARKTPADCPFPNWEPPPAPPVAAVDSIPLGRRRARP